jgi:3-deoxy-manno-octulosonate cytidylyltransferase (CMP-KDO synthetase)
MKVAAVIPARFGSTRFPGKVLASLGGKPIVPWGWEAAKRSKADTVLVATDDTKVRNAVEGFGGKAIMTAASHPSGSDRIWEAIQGIEADIIINVQGDEPLMPPEVINGLIEAMASTPAPDMATVIVPCKRNEVKDNPNLVKAVVGVDGFALYFSRSMIPFLRDGGGVETDVFRHWGIYAYTRNALKRFVSLPEGKLEQCEKLEQLRALENGMRIKTIRTAFQSIGIDTPMDLTLAAEAISDKLKLRDQGSK